MVDVVVAWVDGNDPKHIEKRNKYLKFENKSGIIESGGEPARWIESNEIWYCLESIRRHLPWVNNIYLITDKQAPCWLNEKEKARLGINIIDHTVIFNGLEDLLPTFNSISIESLLHRIPNLDEEFIYFNDDMFIIRDMSYNEFFANNKIKIRGDIFWPGNLLGLILHKLLAPRVPEGYCAYLGGSENRVSAMSIFRRAHAPYPMLKSLCNTIFSTKFIYENASYKFRHKKQLSIIDIIYNQALKYGKADIVTNDWGYIPPANHDNFILKDLLSFFKENHKIKTLCIQALEGFPEEEKVLILELLNTCILDKNH